MDRFLIVGTGRCGTGFVAKALTDCGVPCGHEAVYSIQGLHPWNPANRGEASWLAVPYLRTWARLPVFWLMRNPLHTISSLSNDTLGPFAPSMRPSRHYLEKILGPIPEGPIVDKAARFYATWCELIRRHGPLPVWILESFGTKEVEQVGGDVTRVEEAAKKWKGYNWRPQQVQVTPDMITDKHIRGLVEQEYELWARLANR